eukprot:7618334-Pyramimonas_sp.AAC.1
MGSSGPREGCSEGHAGLPEKAGVAMGKSHLWHHPIAATCQRHLLIFSISRCITRASDVRYGALAGHGLNGLVTSGFISLQDAWGARRV